MRLHLVLEGAPQSKKNGWGFGRGRVFMKPETRQYIQAVKLQAKSQMTAQGFVKIANPAQVAVRAMVYFTPRQRMDVHNAMETVLDALQQVVYDNDRQVVGHHYPPMRLIDTKRPRVELEIQPASEAAADPNWGLL